MQSSNKKSEPTGTSRFWATLGIGAVAAAAAGYTLVMATLSVSHVNVLMILSFGTGAASILLSGRRSWFFATPKEIYIEARQGKRMGYIEKFFGMLSLGFLMIAICEIF